MPDQPKNNRKTILIADDDPMIQRLFQIFLSVNYNLVITSDGIEALDYLNRHMSPDLILLDIEMPKMSGLLFMENVRSVPKFNLIPVIIVSGSERQIINTSFSKLGVCDFIQKPFSIEDVENVIFKTLINKQVS